MNKIITFIITAIIVFICLVIYNTTLPEKAPPANAPFIIKSNVPGTCRISTMTASTDIKKNIHIVACKMLLSATY